jgi:pilus assembly protein CpaE
VLRNIRIVIVEERVPIRDRLAVITKAIPEFTVVAKYGSATESLAKIDSDLPDIVFLDTDTAEIDNLSAIEHLLKASPGLSIICTSLQWDETSARMAIQAGAKGFIPKSCTLEELVQAIEAIDNPKLLPTSEVITLLSPKGNCGQTTVAVNLAVALAEKTGHKVGIIDANIQFGDVTVFLNIEPVATIVETARDLVYLFPVTFDSYLTPFGNSVKVLAAARKPEQAELITSRHIRGIIELMRSLFRYVVVDAPAGLNGISIAALESADWGYLLAAQDAGRETLHLRRFIAGLQQAGVCQDRLGVIITRATTSDVSYLKRVEKELACPVIAALPDEFCLAAAGANSGIPIVSSKPAAPLSSAIWQLTNGIANRDAAAG